MKQNEKFLWYTKEENLCIESHIRKHFGNIDFYINGLDRNNENVVKIAAIKPKGTRNYWTLVTIGIGAYRMNIPKEYVDIESRLELVMYIQPEWNCGADILNSPDSWPVDILFKMAQIPIEQKDFLCRGLSVEFTSKGKSEFIRNTNYTSAMIMPCFIPADEADICVLPNKEAVGFSNVLPLYQEEVEYYKSTSLENMIKKFNKLFEKPIAHERKNLCQGTLK